MTPCSLVTGYHLSEHTASTFTIQASSISKTYINIHQYTRCHIPAYNNLAIQHRQKRTLWRLILRKFDAAVPAAMLPAAYTNIVINVTLHTVPVLLTNNYSNQQMHIHVQWQNPYMTYNIPTCSSAEVKFSRNPKYKGVQVHRTLCWYLNAFVFCIR
jgi:hypothetical protein